MWELSVAGQGKDVLRSDDTSQWESHEAGQAIGKRIAHLLSNTFQHVTKLWQNGRPWRSRRTSESPWALGLLEADRVGPGSSSQDGNAASRTEPERET